MRTVSIVIPILNEERHLEALLKKVFEAVLPDGFSREVVAVDDGSTDQSRAILERVSKLHSNLQLVFRDKPGGKGRALRDGFSIAQGDILLVQDADLEYNPSDYEKLLIPFAQGHTGMVLGSRKLSGAFAAMSFPQWLANTLLTGLTNFLYRSTLSDQATCYKVFPKSFLDSSFELKSEGFEFCAEIVAKTLRLNAPIVEVPVEFHPRGYTEGKKIKFYHFMPIIMTLIRERFAVTSPDQKKAPGGKRAA